MDAEAERLHLLFCRPVMLLDPRVEDAESVRIRDLLAVLDRAALTAADLEKDMYAAYTRQRHYPLTARIPGISPTLGAYLLAEIGDRPAEREAVVPGHLCGRRPGHLGFRQHWLRSSCLPVGLQVWDGASPGGAPRRRSGLSRCRLTGKTSSLWTTSWRFRWMFGWESWKSARWW